MLNIQPIGFDLSFVRTNQADNEDENSALAKLDTGYNPVVDYALNVVTMALGNINVRWTKVNRIASMLMILYREHLFDSMLWQLKICELVHLILPIVSRSITVISLSINTIESSAQLTFWAIQASRSNAWWYVFIANMIFITVGLFNNISSGVAELFYEPWQGIMISDRPHELGVGIARVIHLLNR